MEIFLANHLYNVLVLFSHEKFVLKVWSRLSDILCMYIVELMFIIVCTDVSTRAVQC